MLEYFAWNRRFKKQKNYKITIEIFYNRIIFNGSILDGIDNCLNFNTLNRHLLKLVIFPYKHTEEYLEQIWIEIIIFLIDFYEDPHSFVI